MIDLPPGGISPPDQLPVIRDSTPVLPGELLGGFPNDPLYPTQWALHNSPADIDWANGWTLLHEIIGPGATPQRPQLFIVDSRFEVPAIHSGEVAWMTYWNAGTGLPFPSGNPCTHSLHVGSIAAAVTNNGYGTAGVTTADIHAVQVLNQCNGQQWTAAAGVVYAVDHGADVVNMSLQYGFTPDPVFQQACDYAESMGVVVVAASGNYSSTTSTAVPSLFDTVIAVGAIRQNGTRPEFSNAGPQLDLCAPGESVLGATMTGFEAWSGTSMASPHVAGVACAILTAYPDLTPDEVKQALYTGAVDLGAPGWDWFYGHGKVSLYRSLQAARHCPADADGNGELTVADFGAFQRDFAAGLLKTDMNWDGRLTIADFGSFQARFTEGCP